ncbi:MAG: deacylase [Flavobacterium sp.]|nr:MAG: deacylase [Flavobacterium sp.]
MSKILSYFFLFISICAYSQNDSILKYTDFTSVEFALGKTIPINEGFPELNLNKTLFLSFGKTNLEKKDEWVYRLRYPRTGISFALTNYGNPEYMGYSLSVLSFIEYDLLRKHLKGLTMQMGGGASYFTYNYKNLSYAYNNAPQNNNRAISTKITWSFKVFLYYALLKNKQATWKVGLGLFHQSNGHTNLPNDALNTAFISITRQNYYNEKKPVFNNDEGFITKKYSKSSNYYFDFRFGLGINVLTEDINDRSGVYTISGSLGKIFNNIIKVGFGFHYRIYGNYYKYIENEGELVIDEYPHFMETPLKYASNYGAFVNFELLLGHIGLDVTFGYNIYKPFYKVDYQLQKGFYWEFTDENGNTEPVYILGELGSSYKKKEAIYLRAGLKYYLINNEKKPKNNFYLGAHINSNFGEADFSEFSMGYIHNFGFKQK